MQAADFWTDVQRGLAPGRLSDADSKLLLERIAGGFEAIATRFGDTPSLPSPMLAGFAEHVATKVNAASPAALARFRLDDLFLAYWASFGDASAIRRFEGEHAGVLARAVARFPRLPEDELRQRLRLKLFVAAPGGRARLLEYGGFGFLENWVKVTAIRCFMDLATEKGTVNAEDDALLDLPSAGHDASTALLKAEMVHVMKEAFASAVEGMERRERTYLRHSYVDGLTLDQIATLHHVHRATVARVLFQAREALATTVRKRIREVFGGDERAWGSSVALLDSHFDLSLSRVLASNVPPSEAP